MGELIYRSYVTTLTANGASGVNVDVVTYAWASDVELLGTTDELSLQSTAQNDEYAMNGVISRPASAIAEVADTLTKVPVIGPFATATSMAATGIGKAAALLGYSKTKDVSDTHYVKPSALPNLAAPDMPESVDKLTLDAKNELTVDPRVTGCSPDDPMSLGAFAARESVFAAISWPETATTGTDLINIGVHPGTCSTIGVSSATRYAMTPSCYASQCFQYWRGDMIYRVKVIASQYHRGRLQISWDPRKSSYGTVTDISSSVYNTIMDIGENTELEFRVPMSQTVQFLETITPPTTVHSTISTIPVSATNITYNGVVTVKVLTELSSPTGTAPASIIFSSRAGDHFEFAGPIEPDANFSPYTPQSMEMDYQMEGEVELGGGSTNSDPSLSTIYMGEKVPSIRTLCQRTCAYATVPVDVPTVGTSAGIGVWTHHRLPVYPGFDPAGTSGAIGAISGVTEPFNWVCWNYSTWFSLCYVGQRGAVNYYISPFSEASHMPQLMMSRFQTQRTVYTMKGVIAFQGSSRNYINSFTRQFASSCRGAVVSHTTANGTLSASLPMYSNYKFVSNSSAERSLGSDGSVDNSERDGFRVLISQTFGTTDQCILQVFTSAGPDFSLVYFQNIPSMYLYTADPVPA